jgi:hypothetical protein
MLTISKNLLFTSSVRGEQPSQLSSIMPPHSTSRLQLMPPTQNSSSSTTENVPIYPVCFPNICWHSGLNNQWKYVLQTKFVIYGVIHRMTDRLPCVLPVILWITSYDYPLCCLSFYELRHMITMCLKYFCFCQPRCYCFLRPKWGRPKTYLYTPVILWITSYDYPLCCLSFYELRHMITMCVVCHSVNYVIWFPWSYDVIHRMTDNTHGNHMT